MTENSKTKFDPDKHLTEIKGKKYLEVKWRLVWFRGEHPDWSIQTEVIARIESMAIAKAVIRDKDERILATAHKMEIRTQTFADYLEKAETGAIGRALALLGYGTQFAPEMEEGGRIVDSPIERYRKIEEESRERTQETAEATKYKWANDPISPKQISRIYAVATNKFGYSDVKIHEIIRDKYGKDSMTALTKGQASELIDEWTKVPTLGKSEDKEADSPREDIGPIEDQIPF